MQNPDDLIDKALADEERELLRAIGEEPHYVVQALGLFSGRTGWVNLTIMVAQAIAFLFGVFAAFRFFAANTPLEAVQWGLPAATLILISLILKTSLYPAIQTNRLMRELKRLELQIALARQA